MDGEGGPHTPSLNSRDLAWGLPEEIIPSKGLFSKKRDAGATNPT
jgi:hypothetical protein